VHFFLYILDGCGIIDTDKLKGVNYMSKYFTVVTAVDKSLDGKSFYSGQAKTEKKSIDIAIENYKIGKIDDDDTVLAIRTYDDISSVSLKAIRA
tara:strand:- start:49 stop:330 length:282 start_codon:yes stop_codon:yes gene_type:complete